MKNIFYLLGQVASENQKDEFNNRLIKQLIDNLPESGDKNKEGCHDYFYLLCELIKQEYKTSNEEKNSAAEPYFKQIMVNLIERIKNHRSTEARH